MRRVFVLLPLLLAVAPEALAHGSHGHAQVIAEAPGAQPPAVDTAARRWLAGDHHVHSRFSVSYQPSPEPGRPPTPVLGGDAPNPIPRNAAMARTYGLSWMVSTDHGGPLHSKVAYEQGYPELVRSRAEIPEVLQFYGIELDTPAADHSSLIIPHTPNERDALRELESRFSKREAWPADPNADAEPRMLEALRHMRAMSAPPVVIANHPSRSATAVGEYGLTSPKELRAWNDTAPRVAVGMEGAPGHQAATLAAGGIFKSKGEGARGFYRQAPTMGGFDQMTARLGGFWDAMLGEGRRWWVTSTSDAHVHYREGGGDFWPGEYSKTYVLAGKTHDDILDGLRTGRVFVTTGDLVSELDVWAEAGGRRAGIGGALAVTPGADVTVTIRLRDPEGANHGGRKPAVARVDLIVGEVTGVAADPGADHNPTTRVERRFTGADWKRDGEILTMRHTLRGLSKAAYLRVRGTNTQEPEPAPDPRGENPWDDLWFYANPIFLELRSR